MRSMLGPVFIIAVLVVIWGAFFRGNPGGISDALYSKYQSTASPKILYSCTTKPTRAAFLAEVRSCSNTGRTNCEDIIDGLVTAGTKTHVDFVSGASYDQLLNEARHGCAKRAGDAATIEFSVLEAVKT